MRGPFGAALWTGVFAVLLTALVSGVWSGLLVLNLMTTPAIPWSALAMAAILWALWSWMGGLWGPVQSREARRSLLRAISLSRGTFALAVAAGICCDIALAGLWIVIGDLTRVPGNATPDFSRYPLFTVIVTLAMASISGGVSEEAGFRGYFQGTLEKSLPAPLAILICAVVMAPEHAMTQGFVLPTMAFYLLVDIMLGTSAALTKSILPGIVTHAIGLLIFFALVWPADKTRALGAAPDPWFWIHAGQVAVFGAAGILLFLRLARPRTA